MGMRLTVRVGDGDGLGRDMSIPNNNNMCVKTGSYVSIADLVQHNSKRARTTNSYR